MITLVVARAQNGAIGRDGDIPWHIPADLQTFKRETFGGAVIMGRKTWDSLPFKPLPNRLNIVVSRDPNAAELVVPSLEAAIELAQEQGYDRIYGIGGARIYAQMLPLADRLLISEVDMLVEDADTFFPAFSDTDWRCINKRALKTTDAACVVHEYLRQR